MTTAPRIEHEVEAYLSNEDSADISNPIHSAEVAAQFGFRGALIGGVTVWGWATPTILEALGDGWLGRGWAEFAFRQPVYPDDRLTVVAEPADGDEADAWSITMTNQEGVDCVRGTVGLGDASWLDELTTPELMNAAPSPDPMPPLVLESAPAGQDWLPFSVDATAEFAREVAVEKQHSEDPRFVGAEPLLHPAWTAGWAEGLMRHNVYIPSSMHTRSRVQHLAPIPAGQTVTGGAHFLEAYERRAHHFANYDVLLRGEDGTDLARLRHWTVFRIATPEERAAASE
jgi:acyl dehydratase